MNHVHLILYGFVQMVYGIGTAPGLYNSVCAAATALRSAQTFLKPHVAMASLLVAKENGYTTVGERSHSLLPYR